MWSSKDVYYVSDGTGILATNLGQALICQFPETSFNEERFPFIRTLKEAKKIRELILERSSGRRPLIFSTIIDAEVRALFDTPEVEFFDAFGGFLDRLEGCIEAKALRVPGFSHHTNDVAMNRRTEAIHYCLEHDDGTKTNEYDQAEVILLGVSRAGKTPVSVYLATQMGLRSANFPLTSEYLNRYRLPDSIRMNRKKAVGLTTSAELLHSVREQRYPGSNYAKISTCVEEIEQAKQIFLKEKIPLVNTAGRSIEEIAIQVTQHLGIARKALL